MLLSIEHIALVQFARSRGVGLWTVAAEHASRKRVLLGMLSYRISTWLLATAKDCKQQKSHGYGMPVQAALHDLDQLCA